MSEERFVQDGKLEARVESTSQNAKGWYIRLLLHPSDTDEVTKLRVGAVLDIRWREVLNVEVEPIEVEVSRGGSIPDLGTVPRPQANEAGISKPKKRFEEYPLSAQSAMLCDELDFRTFLATAYPIKWGHSLANNLTDQGRAAETVRALCNVTSRRELDQPGPGATSWGMIYGNYLAWQTDQKYAGARR